jgi:hypothetical protein
MTVNELIAHLERLQQEGYGERIVEMGDPRTDTYEEVTGLWMPDDDAVVCLESLSWTPVGKGLR